MRSKAGLYLALLGVGLLGQLIMSRESEGDREERERREGLRKASRAMASAAEQARRKAHGL